VLCIPVPFSGSSYERSGLTYLVLLGSPAHLHFLGSLVHLEVLVHQEFQVSLVSLAPQEALGWSGWMRSDWGSG
jgi:hypothetical protein